MPGPLPKDPRLRQRRNGGGARRFAADTPAGTVPLLPALGRGKCWHRLALQWWRSVWESPLASEYIATDRDGLYILARLVHGFWTAKETDEKLHLAAEIRQQSARFGLSPLDRRRLEWEIERGEQAGERTAGRRQRKDSPQTPGDPRKLRLD